MKKCLLFILLFAAFKLSHSQTAPSNTRLFQLNTLKDSELKIVEATPQNVYHVGTANSEIGFDGLSFSQVGLDDLYILKSSATDGGKVWFKTFNAGVKGAISPRSIYIDSGDNIFMYGTFTGTISAGSTTAASSETVNGFLLKLNSSGTAVWVKPLQLSVTSNRNLHSGAKIATDDTDVFMAYNATNLMRINNTDGSTIYDNVYAGIDFRSILLKNSEIYVAGFSINASTAFNSEIIEGPNQGFVIKGNKDAVFSSSIQTKNAGDLSNVADIAFAGDGDLLISGFNRNRMSLKTSSGIVPYTFAPDNNFVSTKLYYYVAKVSDNLLNIKHFRSSGEVSRTVSLPAFSNEFDSKIVPYGNSSKYRLILSTGSFYRFNSPFTNANGSEITYNESFTTISFLVSADADGNYTGEIQPMVKNFTVSASADIYTAVTPNFRTFNTKVYKISSESLLWTKEKVNSVGGSMDKIFAKHLTSEPSELFFTAIVEGKGNFYGTAVNNFDNQRTRFITRLGVDGQPKWLSKFDGESGAGELGNGIKFSCVDKNDNLYFLSNTKGLNSSFTDAVGTVINFPQNQFSSSKILIKIDKDGKYLWSKIMRNPFDVNESLAAITTDNFGDVYVMGSTLNSDFSVDGFDFDGQTFIMKLASSTGSLIYGKSYDTFYVTSLTPVFDLDNNLYIFSEPAYPDGDYILDGITIPTNLSNNGLDLLFLKFNNTGNVIMGKNFYANAPANTQSYVFPNDVKYNGNDFILMGTMYGSSGNNYLGLDLAVINREYPLNSNILPFMAKIAVDGSVIWQDVFHNNRAATSYTNIELDAQKNIYLYSYARDKSKYRGIEFSYDAIKGDKIAQKFDTAGNLLYTVKVDKKSNPIYPMIDVIKEDTFNIVAITSENNILNYPIRNSNGSNLYITTFGTLDKNYMTPKKDYLELNSTAISSNPAPTPNEFLFDLINNVNWTATSDQSWLNLSSISLTSKSAQQTITGNGDAKITLFADQNTTGATRSSNVIISGENVPSKTIIVTQSTTLGTNNNALSIITLYPNPTSDFLNIKSSQKISKIEIYDMSGKLVRSEKLKDEKVNVQSLLNGNYLLKIQTENGVVTSKFIKN